MEFYDKTGKHLKIQAPESLRVSFFKPFIFNNFQLFCQNESKIMVFKKHFLSFKKYCDIPVDKNEVGDFVKAFEDNLFFIKKETG